MPKNLLVLIVYSNITGFTGLYRTLEQELATHSSILAWRISWTEEPGGLQSMGSTESDTTEGLTPPHTHRTLEVAKINIQVSLISKPDCFHAMVVGHAPNV